MNNLDRVYTKQLSGAEYGARYMKLLSEIMASMNFAALNEVLDVMGKARVKGNTLFFIGNGGSAATCSHFAEDLGGGTMVDGKKTFRAISLVDNSPYITALGNDEGYDQIFAGQLKALFSRGDVVFAISCSGNSPNVLRAVEYANANGGTTIGMTGFDGGTLKKICNHCLHVPAHKGEYALVEDIHLVLTHILCTYSMYKIRE